MIQHCKNCGGNINTKVDEHILERKVIMKRVQCPFTEDNFIYENVKESFSYFCLNCE
jgi:hypothetical protein